MFTCPTPETNKTFEGCQTVPLSDSPEDLVYLLRVLLPKPRVHDYTPEAGPDHTFDELSALIRLADKYHIQHVQDQALTSLKQCFPSNFDTLDTPMGDIPSVSPAQAIGAVNLARLTDTPCILPFALYNCATLGGALLDGWKRSDGTVEYLSPPDLRRCIDAGAELVWVGLFVRVFDEPSSIGCTSRTLCTDILRTFPDVTIKYIARGDSEAMEQDPSENQGIGQFGMEPPLHPLQSWTEDIIREIGDEASLCKSCVEELVRRSYRERKKFWNKLPEILDLTVAGWEAA